ncbi:MAG: aldo/keto reductase [Verrucomicrobiaceae bacterium]
MKEKQQAWCAKLVLGTVQFGLDYGISNAGGKVSPEEVGEILALAGRCGVGGLDTAAAYGTSEEVIGACLGGKGGFEMISKLPGGLKGEEFGVSLDRSLEKLGVESLAGYLVHAPGEMMRSEVREFLERAKGEGKIVKAGVSVYRVEEVERMWEEGIEFDILQVPFNVFDQRFKRVFGELRERGVEVHARSVFLQGLLLMEPGKLPGHFDSVRGKVGELQELARSAGVSVSSLLLNYAMGQEGIDRVLVGVAGLGQLQENLEAFDDWAEVGQLMGELDGFSVLDETIVLPTEWK